MPFIRKILFCFLILSVLIYPKVKVSSYDSNSAIKMTSAGARMSPSNVIATSDSGDLEVLGFWFVNSGLTYSDDIVVMRVAFNNFLFDSDDGSVTLDDINLLGDVVAEIQGDPLIYPNPFSFTDGGTLQYILSKAMDIEIYMYDIFGRQIYYRDCPADSTCGQSNINRIVFDSDEFDGYQLSSGVYFFIFVYEGAVIGRGKMAVVP